MRMNEELVRKGESTLVCVCRQLLSYLIGGKDGLFSFHKGGVPQSLLSGGR